MNVVRRAGEFLKKPIVVDESFGSTEKAAVVDAFTVANSFRDSHVYPMRGIKLSVMHRMRQLGVSGLTAARPKRMTSIRRKLTEGTNKLDQIQDLGGCRVIADDNEGVQAILASILGDFRHTIRKQFPYISEPKADGYRSHHIVFDYVGSGPSEIFNGRRIELQIRTRLQHSWATAVETMGLFRDEDLKHGLGDPAWQRLFALVSAEFSYVESCAVHASMPDRSSRVAEIKHLNAKLRASESLDKVRVATNYVRNYVRSEGKYILIRYNKDHKVHVETFSSVMNGAHSLRVIEEQIVLGENDAKVVLVEVDKIERLADAYPNYFGDVSLFVQNLRSICEGKDAIEYSMVPQERVQMVRPPAGDPRSLSRRYGQWTDAISNVTKGR